MTTIYRMTFPVFLILGRSGIIRQIYIFRDIDKVFLPISYSGLAVILGMVGHDFGLNP